MKYLFGILLVLGLAMAYSPEPLPHCSTPKNLISEFPITLNQIQPFHLDDYFTGYNLQFSLQASAPNFAHLNQKSDLVKKFNTSQPGLKSYHFDHNGNAWGKTLITLSQVGDVSTIRWGFASANDTVPELSKSLVVESEPNTYCYDAIWMMDQHLAIVDCAKNVERGELQNIFIYVNTTSGTVLPTIVENDMYVKYRTITRRRMVILREDGYNYLIRAYYADGVDMFSRNNTYLQILTFNDPFKPRTLKIMDRSFLHQKTLHITDFKLYMGNMYLLDYHSGVIVFDITPNQNIIIQGRYRTDSGYLRLGVYSGDLDNEIIFALANSHAIYEVDFTNQLKANIVAKYSIMSSSHIHSLWVNNDYVIAQITANVTSQNNVTTLYNSTMVFSRGTRSYLNAHQVFDHSSSNVIIDFQRQDNLLFIMEENQTALHKLNVPLLYLYPTDISVFGKQYKFFIEGLSVNSYTARSLVCHFDFKFTVVDPNDMKMYPTGLQIPDTYYANYPGQLFIPLHRYVYGPNITFNVHENDHPNMSEYWILQQNDTIIHWQKQPSLAKITFLRQQQFDSLANTQIWIYTQDAANKTHFVNCTTKPFSKDVYCHDGGFMDVVNYKISNLTAHRFDQYEGWHVHLVAVKYQELINQVFIYEAETKKQITKPIIFSSDPYEGVVTNIQFIGPFLAVLMRYTKQIKFFDMRACIDHQQRECKELFTLDSIMMDRIGVAYFSPLDIYISDFHPNVLFIQNLDRVIILSVSRNGVKLLSTIMSPGTQEPGFHKYKIAIAQDHLLIINPPNLIQQHTLRLLYHSKDALLIKKYPTYNYNIPDNFDVDFSDQGNLVYITATDKKLPESQNSVILVYRTGLPAVAAFYDVYHIGMKFDDMLIDATGAFSDYVTVAMGSILHMYRQYEFPILVFEDSFGEFNFNVTYSNDPDHHEKYLSHSVVKVAGHPVQISINDTALTNPTFLSNQVDYQNDQQVYVLNDSTWFNGYVVNYTVKGCSECGDKINIINHVEHKRDFHGTMDMDDYVFTPNGGVVQQFQSVITMQHNGSVHEFVSFPSIKDGEHCRHITFSWQYDFSVSACDDFGQVYLYMSSLVPSKPFVLGPYASSAKRVASMQTLGDLFILVDVDEDPSILSRQGGVLIYSINHDINENELFDEIDFIDTDDLSVANGWNHDDQIFIGNAHLVWTNESDLYRLAITELRYGVFFVDFKWSRGRRELEIVKVQFMDLKQELFNAHLSMPNTAYFEGVVVSKEYYNAQWRYWEVELIVTTRNFHIFQVNCQFDKTGTLNTHKIVKVFNRYAYYQTQNYIKAFDGYFAVVQSLPATHQGFDTLTRELLTVYDTRQRWTFETEQKQPKLGDIPAFEMLGGYALPRGRITFDFNFTFTRNSSDPFRDIGLLVLNSHQARIRDFLLHDYIAIKTSAGIESTQDAIVVAWNDFSEIELPLQIIIDNGSSGLPGWAIALIVIGSLLVAGLGGFVGWRLYLKSKATRQQEPAKKSLLEKEGESDEESNEDSDDEDQDSDDEDEDEQGGQKQEAKISQKPLNEPTNTIPTGQNIHGSSINRDTLESTDGRVDQESFAKTETVAIEPQNTEKIEQETQQKQENAQNP